MTSLSEAFESLEKPRIGRPCRTCVAVLEMDAADRETLERLLTDSEATNPAITAAMVAAGYEATVGSVSRHRRGECKPLD